MRVLTEEQWAALEAAYGGALSWKGVQVFPHRLVEEQVLDMDGKEIPVVVDGKALTSGGKPVLLTAQVTRPPEATNEHLLRLVLGLFLGQHRKFEGALDQVVASSTGRWLGIRGSSGVPEPK